MDRIDYKQVDEARKILGLGEDASLEEIRDSFRKLSLEFHPDRCYGQDKKRGEEIFKKINHAREIIGRYCAGYRYSFREKDVKKNTMSKEEYEHLKRFYDGWFGDLGL